MDKRHPTWLAKAWLVLALWAGVASFVASRALAGGAAALIPYANARFGYAIAYPANFAAQGESDNADGQVFLAPGGGGEMRVYAGHNALDQTLADRYREALADLDGQAAYAVSRKDWFVVSGLAGGRVHYEKTVLRHGVFFTVSFTYAASERAEFDPLIGPIVQSLRLP